MMAANKPIAVGRHVLGLGVMALGALSLVWRDFVTGQSVPDHLAYRADLACVAGAFMLISGALIQFRRTTPGGAIAIAAYFTLVVMVVMDGAELLSQWMVYGEYENAAEQIAMASGALIVFAVHADIDPVLAARLKRLGEICFAVCALIFGGAHFVYMNLTAPLVPKWLPFSAEFWGYATGLCHMAAGLAILTGIRARLAAILLTIMYASFQPLVHIPMLLHDPASHFLWVENATNLALTGVAWVVADGSRKIAPDETAVEDTV